MPQQVSIRFDCELVDEIVMALRVVASARLLPNGASHGDPPSSAIVFRGPIDSSKLEEQIQDVLWCAIDLAQRQGVSSALGSDEFWLDLVQGLEE